MNDVFDLFAVVRTYLDTFARVVININTGSIDALIDDNVVLGKER